MGEGWPEDASVDFGEEENRAQPVVGNAVAMRPRDPLDEAVEAKAAKLVGHHALRHEAGVDAQRLGEGDAQVPIRETARQEEEK
jgi:hypothetical protein